MSSSDAQPSSLEDWSRSFHDFLLDNNYGTLTTRNLHNIYNLLFVHSQRPGMQQTVFGPSPGPDNVIEHMFSSSLLHRGSGDDVTVAK